MRDEIEDDYFKTKNLSGVRSRLVVFGLVTTDPAFFGSRMAHSSLRAHIKLTRLCRALKVKAPLAVGLLQHLWWQVYETEAIGSDGVLGGWTVDDIASAASWDREGAPFVEALCNVGFLDQSGDGTFSIHDYARWAPDYVKRRWRRTADRTATDQRPDSGRLPNPTQRNQTQPKSKKSTSSPGREVRAEKPKAPRPRNKLWDACQAIQWPKGVPKSQESLCGRLCVDFEQLGASADDISLRFKRMCDTPNWPAGGHTLTALVNNWHQFKDPVKDARPGRVQGEEGKYDHLCGD